MAQATFSVRMDESLKRQFDSLCQDFGMSTSTAINVFARAVVREKRIPFEISSSGSLPVTRENAADAFNALRAHAVSTGISDMSFDEIEAEISAAREEAKQ